MFEGESDGAVVAVIETSARASAAADARRLAAIAELTTRRCGDGDSRDYWACDPWSAVAAEVSAAMTIGHRAASREMHIGLALRDRLPRIAALYAQGLLSTRVVSTITWRASLIEATDALAAIDADLADRAPHFSALSDSRLAQAIDQAVHRHDPDALRRLRDAVRDRDVHVGDRDDTTGTASLRGRLLATDATRLKRRLAEMARQVCAHDPRTMGQRRSDAMGVLVAGGTHLPCRCDTPDCPAAAVDDPRATTTVIHVLTEPATLDATPDPAMHGDHHPQKEMATEAQEAAPPTRPAQRPAAIILGGGVIPAPLLAELLRAGATLQPIRPPCTDPQDRYRPSAALADFVRMRDMTCRYPGCNRPADAVDIDHTVPYPTGATHPSNLACLCRHHHLLKTFWDGFSPRQHPDGTITWTTPAGRTYTTHPASRLFYPTWHTTTTDIPTSAPAPKGPDRAVMMPTRRRTSTQDRAQRITTEREANRQHRQALTHTKQSAPHTQHRPPPPDDKPPHDKPPHDDEPPPF